MNSDQPKAYNFIPTDADAAAILHQRAIECANMLEEEENIDVGFQYVKFKLGQNELYGIDFGATKGVVQVSNMMKPPCVSPVICGVINYQGKLIGVLDIEKILNLKSKVKDSNDLSNIIIVNSKEMTMGMIVGEIEMSDYYKPESLADSVLSERDIEQGFIKGVDKGKVAIINVDKILSSIRITEGEVS